MIEVKNLTKKYGNHNAVDDLSFTIEKGKIYGFLGPNGAGKSTTMNIITGYLAATAGEVKICGKDILKEAEEAKKHIGYLPENPPLYMDMTVEEYLKFVAELKKVPKIERKEQIELVMEETNIADMRNRMIQNLSKGYKQRVGLAQSMLGNPEIIILDEPTVGLDPKQILEIRDLIRSMKEKHTVILSSHILSEVSAVCDEIMILSKGKLVASDTAENLSKQLESKNREALRVELLLKAKKEKVEGLLSTVSCIDLEKCEEIEDGFCNVTVISKESREYREELFYLLAEYKIPVYKMVPEGHDLESIFLELTSKEEGSFDSNSWKVTKKEAENLDNNFSELTSREEANNDSNL